MSKTIAQHSADYRARRSARIKRMEAGYGEIISICDETGEPYGFMIDRIKLVASQALSPSPNEREP